MNKKSTPRVSRKKYDTMVESYKKQFKRLFDGCYEQYKEAMITAHLLQERMQKIDRQNIETRRQISEVEMNLIYASSNLRADQLDEVRKYLKQASQQTRVIIENL